MPLCQHELCLRCKGLGRGEDKSKPVKIGMLRKIRLRTVCKLQYSMESVKRCDLQIYPLSLQRDPAAVV